MTLCVTSQWELVTWQCSSYAGLSDPYSALVLYLAGDALHHQPMGGWSHDCSSYVGCGDFRVLHWCRPMPACISGNKLWHPDDYLIWRPRTGFRPAHFVHRGCMYTSMQWGRQPPWSNTPWGRHPPPPKQTPSGADTLWDKHPLGQTPPGRHLLPQDTTGCGQHAGGTHHTGMHTCFVNLLAFIWRRHHL